MRTHPASRLQERSTDAQISTSPQTVAVVNSTPEMLAMVEAALEVGQYKLVFLKSQAHAYAEIKRLRPHLVILCTRIEHLDDFQLLSMLKLDRETRNIPVVTFTTEDGPEESADEDVDTTGTSRYGLN